MLTFLYRAYIGYMGYLCAYIPNREGKRERRGTQTAGEEHQQKGKRSRRKKHKINSA
nr:MAG: hypothetical protein [Bacteriophage sp.]